jgi:hypothetical protein
LAVVGWKRILRALRQETAMILTALALSFVTTAAGPPAGSVPNTLRVVPRAEPMPNFFRQPARCGPLHDQIARRQDVALKGHPRYLQYAVLRQVDGCALSSPVGYHPDYLLPGRADAPRFRPASDADAPKP